MQFEERIDKILKEYPAEQRYSLAILQDIQHEFQYIPKDAMEAVAEYLNLPLSSLYSMATFYKALSLKPKGRNIIKLCDGTACHVRGSSKILESVTKQLGIGPDETTEDGEFSLEIVNCLGCCSLSPVMMINDETFGSLTPEKTISILNEYRERGEEA